jgi:hypothetical protein
MGIQQRNVIYAAFFMVVIKGCGSSGWRKGCGPVGRHGLGQIDGNTGVVRWVEKRVWSSGQIKIWSDERKYGWGQVGGDKDARTRSSGWKRVWSGGWRKGCDQVSRGKGVVRWVEKKAQVGGEKDVVRWVDKSLGKVGGVKNVVI